MIKLSKILLIAFTFAIVTGIPDTDYEYEENYEKSREGEIEVDGVRYWFDIRLKFDWYAAIEHCKNMNMDLIEIYNSDENKRLIKILEEHGSSNLEYWTGAKRNRQGIIVWNSDRKEMKYSHMNIPAEPVAANRNCIRIRNKSFNYVWNEYVCADELNIICYKPKKSSVAAIRLNGFLIGVAVMLKLAFNFKF